jgi:molybdenum cofactor biosynthesis enzyme MoaA
MRVQTFSVIAGSAACNARCPFCVSRMTPALGVDAKPPEVNWRNFEVACRFARDAGVSTALLTGKGEPSLFPAQLGAFIERLQAHGFPFIELQTNGLTIPDLAARSILPAWYERGLTTVALSVVHHDADRNRPIYTPHRERYPDLPSTIEALHEVGFQVRLSVILVKGAVATPDDVAELVAFARRHRVEQLSVRPVRAPGDPEDDEAAAWVREHELTAEDVEAIRRRLDGEATPVMRLLHGAVVYDWGGQNVCLTDCLTLDPQSEDLRQLIFFPDGAVRYDWRYPGARLL